MNILWCVETKWTVRIDKLPTNKQNGIGGSTRTHKLAHALLCHPQSLQIIETLQFFSQGR